MPDLEERLIALAADLRFPATPDISSALRTRLELEAPTTGSAAAPLFTTRRLVLAAFIILAIVAGVAAYPPSRDAVARFFHIRGVSVERSPHGLSSPSPEPAATVVERLHLGRAVSGAEAAATAGFSLPPPPATLGPPDAVLVRSESFGTAVSYLYLPRAGLPDPHHTGVGLLLTALHADYNADFFRKVAPEGTTIATVQVSGVSGYWIAGQPHGVYVGSPTDPHLDQLRLAEDTLLWEKNGVTYRVEAAVGETAALAIGNALP